MAIAYQSVGSVTYASGNTVTIPKPTGLSAGDLMVAIIHQKDVDTATCTRTGWTAIDTMDLNATSGDYAFTLYKVADSTDASASNFVFTLNRTNYVAGAIFRITGQAGSSIINAHNWAGHGSNTTNHSYADTITPSVADCLLIMAIFNSGNTTNSGYAISTDNPTWTESFDIGSGGAGRSFAGAYANRPQTTATGNSASSTGANDFSSSTIIAIKPFSVINTTLVAGQGSYTYTGYASLFKKTLKILASYGSYIYTGFDATLTKGTGYLLSVVTGFYTYTGFDVMFTRGLKILASYGSYIYTGFDATLLKKKYLIATTGYYTYTGFAVRLPRYWRNITKNVGSWLNSTKNIGDWINTQKTDLS